MSQPLNRIQILFREMDSLRILVLGYLSYIVVGWILLSLPWCQGAEGVGGLDNLFVACSAVSTTGLATVDVSAQYNFWGHLIILILLQIGGLGYMTLGSFVILARKQELPPIREGIARVAFTLPEGFQLRVFLRQVVVFSLLIELVGAVGLFAAFRQQGMQNPLWPAIFHSASAFCTAGFSIFPNSLEDFRADFWVNVIISALSLLGAIGFLVMSDFWQVVIQYKRQMTLTSRIILHTTFWSLLIGWGLLFLESQGMESQEMASIPVEERLMMTGFQAMSALTTVGFNTNSLAEFQGASLMLLLVLMILGASPSGTGGGLKSTSVSAALAVMWSTIRGRQKIDFWGQEIPPHRLYTAFAAVVFYLVTYLVGTSLLMLVESQQPFEDLLFESASALGTVGLSRGTTASLTPLGKIVIIVMMFVGRLGPLTFGLALFSASPSTQPRQSVEDVAI